MQRVFAWFGGREPVVLLALFTTLAASWAFVEIADEVISGESHGLDRWVVGAVRSVDDPGVPIGPPWLREMGRDATALGGVGSLVFFTMVAAGYLWLDNKFRLMLLLLSAAVGGLILSSSLKYFFDRPRPELTPYLSHVYTSSFPSGHSMLSAVIYLTLGSLLAAGITRIRVKVYVLSVAVVLTILVGISRIYLGVHYPTDVLAGWLAGIAWAFSCWLITHWLQRRQAVES
jgi:undecaprenyl-diphosphatase